MDGVDDDCGKRSVEEVESCAVTLSGAEDLSKDDLEDALVSRKRTVSLYDDKSDRA